MQEYLPWVSIVVVILGFIGQGFFGSFRLGSAVEQIKATLKLYVDTERDKLVEKIAEMERRFEADQKTQDHNFGEVGAAMRQYTADVEKKISEVELFGRDHYVQKEDFKDAITAISGQIERGNAEIKADLKELQKQIIGPRN